MSTNEQPSSAQNFLIEEYKQLRAEILSIAQELRTNDRTLILAIGAFYAFIFGFTPTNPAPEDAGLYLDLAWLIPPALSFFAQYRSKRDFGDIAIIADYIATVERHCLDSQPRPPGWENYLITPQTQQTKDEIRQRLDAMWSNTSRLFWVTVSVITTAAAIVKLVSAYGQQIYDAGSLPVGSEVYLLLCGGAVGLILGAAVLEAAGQMDGASSQRRALVGVIALGVLLAALGASLAMGS